MNEPFITYKAVPDLELAEDIGEILKQKNIQFIIEEDASNLDASFGNHPLNRDYRIKLKQRDFISANNALSDFFEKYAESVEKDHFLYGFSNDELTDILTKPDEWGELNYQLAQKILKERGKEITAEQLEDYKKQRLNELSKPEKTDYTTIILGYVFAFLYPAAFFLGYLLAYSKKNLPNGQRVYAYSKRQRFHGELILIISSIFFVMALIRIFIFKGKS